MKERISKETFAEQVKTKFRLPLEPDGSLELELMEVSEGLMTDKQEQFSLLFRGPLDAPFQQGMRELEHETLGTCSLFLVPIARNPDGMVYEAAFNRFLEPSEG